jgi:nitroreductase
MNLKEIINKGRAYRSLEPAQITEELVRDLTESAQLAPSCSNNRPWRFVYVIEGAKKRSERLPLQKFAYKNTYKETETWI